MRSAKWPNKPVAELLGGTPRPIKAYDSYGMVDPVRDEKACAARSSKAFVGIKIKGGDGDVANDERMVSGVRDVLGPDIALMLDFNQSLDPAEATRRIARLAPYDLTWIEEPVAQENLLGMAKVRATSPTPIQAGENWWFPRGFAEAIAVGASDFIMPDLMKCGGITGWLRVAGQAEAASIPMSSHLFAEASAHVLAVTPTAHWLEFLDFAARSWRDRPRSSMALTAEPGLGLEWSEARSRNIGDVAEAATQVKTKSCELARLLILDAELIIEPSEHRRHHLRQILRDQPGPGLAGALAVHPHADAGGLERRHALRQHRCDDPGEHVACAGGSKPRRRIGGDVARPSGDATTVSAPLSSTTAPERSAASRTRSSLERPGCLLLISLNSRGNSPSCGVSTTCGSVDALIDSNRRSGASAKLVSASASSTRPRSPTARYEQNRGCVRRLRRPARSRRH